MVCLRRALAAAMLLAMAQLVAGTDPYDRYFREDGPVKRHYPFRRIRDFFLGRKTRRTCPTFPFCNHIPAPPPTLPDPDALRPELVSPSRRGQAAAAVSATNDMQHPSMWPRMNTQLKLESEFNAPLGRVNHALGAYDIEEPASDLARDGWSEEGIQKGGLDTDHSDPPGDLLDKAEDTPEQEWDAKLHALERQGLKLSPLQLKQLATGQRNKLDELDSEFSTLMADGAV